MLECGVSFGEGADEAAAHGGHHAGGESLSGGVGDECEDSAVVEGDEVVEVTGDFVAGLVDGGEGDGADVFGDGGEECLLEFDGEGDFAADAVLLGSFAVDGDEAGGHADESGEFGELVEVFLGEVALMVSSVDGDDESGEAFGADEWEDHEGTDVGGEGLSGEFDLIEVKEDALSEAVGFSEEGAVVLVDGLSAEESGSFAWVVEDARGVGGAGGEDGEGAGAGGAVEGESAVRGVDVGDEDADGLGVDVLADLRGDDVERVVDFLLLAELVDEDADGASAGLGVGEQATVLDL